MLGRVRDWGDEGGRGRKQLDFSDRSRLDSPAPLAACPGIPERDTEVRNTPDEQVGGDCRERQEEEGYCNKSIPTWRDTLHSSLTKGSSS